jgi:CPA1 family monovalent cation:H+ antiporter
VIATVSAGIWVGVHGRTGAFSEQSRAAVTTFWSYVAFALNSFIFLLVGFEVDLPRLWGAWPEILIAYFAMMLARAGVVFGVYVVRGRIVPLGWSAALTWGGLRGALSMVLALSLPESLPNRDLLITITFGVVLLSIVVQGLTMPALIRRLRLAPLESSAT